MGGFRPNLASLSKAISSGFWSVKKGIFSTCVVVVLGLRRSDTHVGLRSEFYEVTRLGNCLVAWGVDVGWSCAK